MRTRRDRGIVLLMVLGFVLVVAILLNVASVAWRRASTDLREDLQAEDAYLEAAGGARWAADRLARGETPGPLERADAEGVLRVRVEGDRIHSSYEPAAGVVRRLSVRWLPGPSLIDWREE